MLAKIIKFLIAILTIVLITDPGDLIFHLKVPLFILIFLTWLALKTINPIRAKNDLFVSCFIFLIIPLYGIAISVLQGNLDDPTFAIGFLKSFLVLPLIIVLFDLQLNLSPYLVKCCIFIPLIIIPTYILITINPINIVPINQFATVKDIAKFSIRDFYGYKVLMLYYRTSPLLVFPLAYSCYLFFYKKEKMLSFISIVAFFFTLFLSGTRANILSAVAIIIVMSFNFLRKKKNKFPLLIAIVGISISTLVFIGSLSFETKDQSSEVKSGHFNSYISLFESNSQYLIWGSGLGSQFYSSGNQSIVSQTELTYFDLVRWFGIPISIIFLLLLLYPVIYLYRNNLLDEEKKSLVLAYFFYLFIAGTNPLLVSSTGMLAIVTIYSLLNGAKDKNLITTRV